MAIVAAYAELELAPGASPEQVKEQYRLLSVAWHPDKWPAGRSRARAEEKMKRVNNANDVLLRHLKDHVEAVREPSATPKDHAARGRRESEAAGRVRREREYRQKLAGIEEMLAADVKSACDAIVEQRRPLLEATDSARRVLADRSQAGVANIRDHQYSALHDHQRAIRAKALGEVAAARSQVRRSRDDREVVEAVVGAVHAARADLRSRRDRLASESDRRIEEAAQQRTVIYRELDTKRQALVDQVEREIDLAAAALVREADAARRRLLRECGMPDDAT
jgi:curved DNA-binding protein CbpA